MLKILPCCVDEDTHEQDASVSPQQSSTSCEPHMDSLSIKSDRFMNMLPSDMQYQINWKLQIQIET